MPSDQPEMGEVEGMTASGEALEEGRRRGQAVYQRTVSPAKRESTRGTHVLRPIGAQSSRSWPSGSGK
jgi:hypothetical protein